MASRSACPKPCGPQNQTLAPGPAWASRSSARTWPVSSLWCTCSVMLGRRSHSTLALGDVLDWWRVEALEENRLLRLRAEMRAPGRAWLDYRIQKGSDGQTELIQRAVFFPRGLAGRCYWWAVYPFHAAIFPATIANIVRAAQKHEAD